MALPVYDGKFARPIEAWRILRGLLFGILLTTPVMLFGQSLRERVIDNIIGGVVLYALYRFFERL
jgi:hypothetical protein